MWIVQEDQAGRRVLEEAVRVWPDGASEYLGRPDYALVYADGNPQTRDVVSARVIRADVASPGRFDAMARYSVLTTSL